jgi:Cu/Ag efflux protein CusF
MIDFIMNKNLKTLILAMLMASAFQSAHAADQKTAPVETTGKASAAVEIIDGEVRKVDKANNKIVMQHSEIKSMGMPGMAMGFRLKDPAMINKLQVGDKVKFTVEQVGNDFVAGDIQAAK